MLRVVYLFILSQICLALGKHFQTQGRHVRLIHQVLHRSKEGLEVEDYCPRERQSSQRLPIYAKINVIRAKPCILSPHTLEMGVARRRIQMFPDFKSPGSSLHRFASRELGEEAGG